MIFLAVVIYFVFRTVKCSDPVFVLMLGFLELTLAGYVYFFFWIVGYQKKTWGLTYVEQETYQNHQYYCNYTISSTTPAYTLAIATLLNTNKWLYYNLRVRHLKSNQ